MVNRGTLRPYRVLAVAAGAEATSHAWGDVGDAVAGAHGVPLIWRTGAVLVAVGEQHFPVVRNARRPAVNKIACGCFFNTKKCIQLLCISMRTVVFLNVLMQYHSKL